MGVNHVKIVDFRLVRRNPLLSAKIPEKASKDAKESPRREITTLLFRAFFQQIYINGFFHADPHPGNLFYLKGRSSSHF
ncbi:AarF/UbiB family protein, partial [Cyanothece sp. BG0011]|uniref:AarF/UbiB family protein n=1 Tax=Cyanothece sp. BG0011 TaxID=2082950 RepID=UPI001E3904AE